MSPCPVAGSAAGVASERARRMRSNASGLVGRSRRLRALSISTMLNADRVAHPRDDLLLPGGQLADLFVEPVRPEMRAGLGGNQLDIDPQCGIDPAHAAFQHIAHAEFAADLPHIRGLALVGVGGFARDHERAGDVRQIGGEIVGDRVGQVVVLGDRRPGSGTAARRSRAAAPRFAEFRRLPTSARPSARRGQRRPRATASATASAVATGSAGRPRGEQAPPRSLPPAAGYPRTAVQRSPEPARRARIRSSSASVVTDGRKR